MMISISVSQTLIFVPLALFEGEEEEEEEEEGDESTFGSVSNGLHIPAIIDKN